MHESPIPVPVLEHTGHAKRRENKIVPAIDPHAHAFNLHKYGDGLMDVFGDKDDVDNLAIRVMRCSLGHVIGDILPALGKRADRIAERDVVSVGEERLIGFGIALDDLA